MRQFISVQNFKWRAVTNFHSAVCGCVLWFCGLLAIVNMMSMEILSSCSPLDSWLFVPAVLCTWRENSHLRPLAQRTRRRGLALPNCYWLILLAGDIKRNPGPTKYPCTVCGKAVRSNQRGILCSRCQNWTHANCCGVSPAEYRRLGEHEDELWYCPGCTLTELPFFDTSIPFANVSLPSHTQLSLVDISNSNTDSEHSELSPLMDPMHAFNYSLLFEHPESDAKGG